MTPPIASPHEASSSPMKAPFRGLQMFVAASAVLGIGSLFGSYNSPSSPLYRTEIGEIAPIVTLGVALCALLLWRLWNKSRVARVLYLGLCAASLALTVILGFDNEFAPSWVRWIDYANAAFTIFALVWLQLPGVRAHFRREEAD